MKLNSIIIVLIISLVLIAILIEFSKEKKKPSDNSRLQKGACTATCGAKADVNNPRHNIYECIKNVLLLEDHLADKSKYCKECCVKHFLLVQAYIAEAIWMAGSKINDHPKLQESEQFFQDIYYEMAQ